MAKKIIDIYYSALMLFLVYTFASQLIQGIIQKFSIELLLYIVLWVFLTIQTTFAYIRISRTPKEKYSQYAMVSDGFDIAIAIYVCSAISSMFWNTGVNELSSYLYLSIPLGILAINQISWFVITRNFDVPAVFRMLILFCGMFIVSVSEILDHSFWNLVIVVAIIVILGILRIINKAPIFFRNITTKLWLWVKSKIRTKRVYDVVSK